MKSDFLNKSGALTIIPSGTDLCLHAESIRRATDKEMRLSLSVFRIDILWWQSLLGHALIN
jgi:hypothetical protein